jgi:hypothetical protein
MISAGMATAAAVGLLLNHFLIESHGVARLMLLCLGPIALFLGIGGMVEPKILWAVGKHGHQLPLIYKVIGGALGVVGLAGTLLLLLFVYQLGPTDSPNANPSPRSSRLLAPANLPAPPREQQVAGHDAVPPEVAPAEAVPQDVIPQAVVFLTYDRPRKRWVPLQEEARQGVHQQHDAGQTTVEYAQGEHALLKVIWPDVLEVGDRFTVELQGANSIELVDLDGEDANARASLPTSDTLVVIEIRREPDKITIVCNGEAQKAYHASGKLRGKEAEAALLAAALRPGFSVKKGSQASFRNARLKKH